MKIRTKIWPEDPKMVKRIVARCRIIRSQVRGVINYMELKKVPPGSYVIREGDSGKRESKDVVVRSHSHMKLVKIKSLKTKHEFQGLTSTCLPRGSTR